MEADPGAVHELQTLIADVHARLPDPQQAWVQANIARDHGAVFAVQGGNLVVHRTLPREHGSSEDDSG